VGSVRRTRYRGGCPTAGDGERVPLDLIFETYPRSSRQVRRIAIDRSGTGEADGDGRGAGGGGGGGQRRQRGRTRGRPPRAADDTKMPSASFSSSRSYVRRSRRKNGNRIPLPRTGKPNERASERTNERTNERASERNGERASERTRTSELE